MKYTKLANSDLLVSRICLGCMGFGDPNNGQHSWTIGEPETRDIILRSNAYTSRHREKRESEIYRWK